MLRKSVLALAIALPTLVGLSACSTSPQIITDTGLLQKITQASDENLFDASSPLLTQSSFEQVAARLNTTTSLSEANSLLYYLRAFSYFGPVDELDDNSFALLTSGLSNLASTEIFVASARLQEQFAVTLYRYYANNEQASALARLSPLLDNQFIQLAKSASDQEHDYALWETLRAYGLLLNVARKDSDGELNKTLLELGFDQTLLDFAGSDNSIRNDKDWPKRNAYWALGLYRLALPASEDANPTQDEAALDEAVADIARQDISVRGDAAKDAYTLGYHVNSFAGLEECEKNSDICRIPEQSKILPIEHHCSDSLFILAQDLNEQELAISCTKLTSQESNFHTLLATRDQPTANDFNDALRVIAFKNWSQYNAYGQLLFDISTGNGGMYIEGTPSKPGNQATFFAYRQFWIQPEFAIWNLNHEYVHYLDGHFIKYGGFGHFPEKMVWWSEGLAEYISKGDDNAKTLRIVKKKLDEAPTLEEIFATEYKDGLERTYSWSYMAIRFLAEHYHKDFVQLSQYLKTDYFEGYDELLAELTQHQDEFSNWLADRAEQFDDSEDQAKPRLHKQNRYSYRDYLAPVHLIKDDAHRHY